MFANALRRIARHGLQAALAAALLVAGLLVLPTAASATATSVSMQLSNPAVGATNSNYTLTFSNYSLGLPKCVKFQFSNGAYGTGGAPSTGDTYSSNGGGSYITGVVGGSYTLDTTNAAQEIGVYNNAGVTANNNTGAVNVVIYGVNNPTISGTYFFTLTVANAAGSGTGDCNNGSVIDQISVPYTINNADVASVTVDSSVTFGVQGRAAACNSQPGAIVDNSAQTTAISLGHLAAGSVRAAAQDLTLITNAGGGATVYMRGTRATTNLYNSASSRGFADSGTTTPVAGTESFGFTESNTHSSLNSTFHSVTNTNIEVAYSATGSISPAQCVGFSAATAANTPALNYSATIIYTAVPTY